MVSDFRLNLLPLGQWKGSGNYGEPREIARFSRDADREVRLDDSELKYYFPPELPSDLNFGFPELLIKRRTRDRPEYLDSLLMSFQDLNRKLPEAEKIRPQFCTCNAWFGCTQWDIHVGERRERHHDEASDGSVLSRRLGIRSSSTQCILHCYKLLIFFLWYYSGHDLHGRGKDWTGHGTHRARPTVHILRLPLWNRIYTLRSAFSSDSRGNGQANSQWLEYKCWIWECH